MPFDTIYFQYRGIMGSLYEHDYRGLIRNTISDHFDFEYCSWVALLMAWQKISDWHSINNPDFFHAMEKIRLDVSLIKNNRNIVFFTGKYALKTSPFIKNSIAFHPDYFFDGLNLFSCGFHSRKRRLDFFSGAVHNAALSATSSDDELREFIFRWIALLDK